MLIDRPSTGPVDLGRLSIEEQVDAFHQMIDRNDLIGPILSRAADLNLPHWYLTAGCLFQTVWNVVTGQPSTDGIKDYDLFYFDDTDVSWEAEDRAIRAAAAIFADLPATVEVRNEARVHLWYEQRFGVAIPPFTSTEAAIDCFAATTCCLGVRLEQPGVRRLYAPHGLADVFNLVIRPNAVLAPRDVYEAKTARWREQWPSLTVLPWPDTS
jgi:hypothetical protein